MQGLENTDMFLLKNSWCSPYHLAVRGSRQSRSQRSQNLVCAAFAIQSKKDGSARRSRSPLLRHSLLEAKNRRKAIFCFRTIRCHYLSSTVAPAVSSFVFKAFASSLFAPSFTILVASSPP